METKRRAVNLYHFPNLNRERINRPATVLARMVGGSGTRSGNGSNPARTLPSLADTTNIAPTNCCRSRAIGSPIVPPGTVKQCGELL
jgi:hypothetical protein